MATASIPSPSDGLLLPEHERALLAANERAKAVYRAASVASFNAWSIGLIAVLSLPFALFSLPSLAVEAGLALIAYNEFRGRSRLRRFDPTASRLLGWNQLGLMALMLLYSLWSIGSAIAGPSPYEAELRAHPELASLGSIDQLYLAVTLAVYGGVCIATIVCQGLNAWYYFTRGRHVRAYLAETPAWVVDLHRAMSPA
jgi:hypothetical protein